MEIRNILQEMNTSLASRENAAKILIGRPRLIQDAVSLLNENETKLSIKALYCLEILARKDIDLLMDQLKHLTHYAKTSENSSANRCLAKIFSLATEKDSLAGKTSYLPSEIKESIMETSFSWLIREESIAVKVFSMQTLWDLRCENDWIAAELKAVLQNDFPGASAGYQSRARKILRKLNHEFSDKI
ncbi:hypothetical protein MKO06_09440 [Gramella sp. GC03-9]|uniref:Adenylosuccinate lyase n=1 Tax=Christiangramia oceanisediminis TaxID=2920386 RepID=A0A9X2KXK7_9FLAO|nr:hypothetical protein [Gramella oceanisediminis]MCP9200131.1 hypothetical protein [Gramella oceanisediminis]